MGGHPTTSARLDRRIAQLICIAGHPLRVGGLSTSIRSQKSYYTTILRRRSSIPRGGSLISLYKQQEHQVLKVSLVTREMASAGFSFGANGENLLAHTLRSRNPLPELKCHGAECEKTVTAAERLGCNHYVCEPCQHLAFIQNQTERTLVRFYSDISNYCGKAEPTLVNALSPARKCPSDCEAALRYTNIPRTPACPPNIKKLLRWNKIEARVEADRLDTLPARPRPNANTNRNNAATSNRNSAPAVEDRRPMLYSLHAPNAEFRDPLSETGVKEIGLANTVYMYPPDAIDFNDLFGSNVPAKLMLFRIRPEKEDYSANALYVWVDKNQKVGDLIEKLVYILGGLKTAGLKDTHYSFLSMNGEREYFGWDRNLGKLFQHNMTLHTELEW